MISSKMLVRRADITYRQLDYRDGTGVYRLFDDKQIEHAVIMGKLTRLGLSPKVASRVALDLATQGFASFGDFTLSPKEPV